MSAELAALPEKKRLRVNWAAASRFTLPFTILVALVFELLLAERKYALFGGGFGMSQALDTPLEIGAATIQNFSGGFSRKAHVSFGMLLGSSQSPVSRMRSTANE